MAPFLVRGTRGRTAGRRALRQRRERRCRRLPCRVGSAERLPPLPCSPNGRFKRTVGEITPIPPSACQVFDAAVQENVGALTTVSSGVTARDERALGDLCTLEL